MKALLTILLCLFCASVVQAQESASNSSAPPAITVTKLRWSREIQSSPHRDSVRSTPWPPGWSGFPSLERTTIWYPEPFGRETISPFPRSGRFSYVYVYSAKIENNGARAIRAVSWDYVITDAGTNEELGRREFYSDEKIDGNSSGTLRGRSVTPPSNIVSLKGLEKDKRSPFNERVEFKCVMYADGTFWENPSAGECLKVRNLRAMRRRSRM